MNHTSAFGPFLAIVGQSPVSSTDKAPTLEKYDLLLSFAQKQYLHAAYLQSQFNSDSLNSSPNVSRTQLKNLFEGAVDLNEVLNYSVAVRVWLVAPTTLEWSIFLRHRMPLASPLDRIMYVFAAYQRKRFLEQTLRFMLNKNYPKSSATYAVTGELLSEIRRDLRDELPNFGPVRHLWHGSGLKTQLFLVSMTYDLSIQERNAITNFLKFTAIEREKLLSEIKNLWVAFSSFAHKRATQVQKYQQSSIHLKAYRVWFNPSAILEAGGGNSTRYDWFAYLYNRQCMINTKQSLYKAFCLNYNLTPQTSDPKAHLKELMPSKTSFVEFLTELRLWNNSLFSRNTRFDVARFQFMTHRQRHDLVNSLNQSLKVELLWLGYRRFKSTDGEFVRLHAQNMGVNEWPEQVNLPVLAYLTGLEYRLEYLSSTQTQMQSTPFFMELAKGLDGSDAINVAVLRAFIDYHKPLQSYRTWQKSVKSDDPTLQSVMVKASKLQIQAGNSTFIYAELAAPEIAQIECILDYVWALKSVLKDPNSFFQKLAIENFLRPRQTEFILPNMHRPLQYVRGFKGSHVSCRELKIRPRSFLKQFQSLATGSVSPEWREGTKIKDPTSNKVSTKYRAVLPINFSHMRPNSSADVSSTLKRQRRLGPCESMLKEFQHLSHENSLSMPSQSFNNSVYGMSSSSCQQNLAATDTSGLESGDQQESSHCDPGAEDSAVVVDHLCNWQSTEHNNNFSNFWAELSLESLNSSLNSEPTSKDPDWLELFGGSNNEPQQPSHNAADALLLTPDRSPNFELQSSSKVENVSQKTTATVLLILGTALAVLIFCIRLLMKR